MINPKATPVQPEEESMLSIAKSALQGALEMLQECNPQWPDFPPDQPCPAGHEFECGACCVRRQVEEAIAILSSSSPIPASPDTMISIYDQALRVIRDAYLEDISAEQLQAIARNALNKVGHQ